MRTTKQSVVAMLTACATLACSYGVANAGDGSKDLDPVTLYSGSDFSPHSQYYYLGSVVPLFRDSATSQILLRGYSSYNHYDYTSDVHHNADEWQGDAMLGYQVEGTRVTMAAFIGVDFQNHRIFPDDLSNPGRGSETGFKVAAEIESSADSPYYFDLDGDYSTAFSTYWARGRLGYKYDCITFGPEASVDGSVGYVSQRLGGFATFDLEKIIQRSATLTLSLGHQFVSGSGSGPDFGGGEGTYGAFSVGFDF